MHGSDLLLAVAEIAVAFAAFSGLVSVLGQGFSQSDPRVVANRLVSVLLTSLLATGFALFPFLPDRLGAPESTTWRVSSAAFAICWTIYVVVSVKRMLRLRKVGIDPVAIGRRIAYLNLGLYIIAIAGLTVVSAGFYPNQIRGVYVFGLFVLLFVSANVFVRLFLSLLRKE